jgi:CubicO group peptidase (beta-lactamase class C family)
MDARFGPDNPDDLIATSHLFPKHRGTHMQLRFVPAAGIAACLVIAPAAAQRQSGFSAFDAYVDQAMKTWKVPGVAIAVVRNDSVIHARGYGIRALGQDVAVDAQTLFAIGSASKAFTATSMAMLVDEGKVRWNDRATLHLPGFQLHDSYATHELTVRDLLSHRSGLSRGDLLWYGSDLSREEILRRVRFLEPSWSFRSQFGYQNLMYLAAGQVIATVSGRSWDDFVRTRIFAPLGMTSSNTSVKALTGRDNVASPHAEVRDTVRVIPWRDIDNIAPAGSINANVTDMAQWVRFNLNRGKAGERVLLSDGNFGELQQPNVALRIEGPQRLLFPDVHLMSYGLGWFLQDYRGRLVVQHGGNIDGMSAMVAMMPEEKIGLVVLTNMNGTPLTSVLMYRAFDHLLGGGTKDWSAQIRKNYEAQQAQARQAEARVESQRKAGTRPSLGLGAYAGTYVDSLYGSFEVAESGGALRARYGKAFQGTLQHWHYDTFRATWEAATAGRAMVQFVLGPDGTVSEARVEGIADFRRRPALVDTTATVKLDAATLNRFVGTYRAQQAAVEAEVQLIGDQLRLTIAGQPPYVLIAESTQRFRVTRPGTPMPGGFFVEFAMDGDRVRELSLIQPAPRPTLTLIPVRRTP